VEFGSDKTVTSRLPGVNVPTPNRSAMSNRGCDDGDPRDEGQREPEPTAYGWPAPCARDGDLGNWVLFTLFTADASTSAAVHSSGG
jgi:hypothetical protein